MTDIIGVGTSLHITARAEEYEPNSRLFLLESVGTSEVIGDQGYPAAELGGVPPQFGVCRPGLPASPLA